MRNKEFICGIQHLILVKEWLVRHKNWLPKTGDKVYMIWQYSQTKVADHKHSLRNGITKRLITSMVSQQIKTGSTNGSTVFAITV
jgi:hypothetical protein